MPPPKKALLPEKVLLVTVSVPRVGDAAAVSIVGSNAIGDGHSIHIQRNPFVHSEHSHCVIATDSDRLPTAIDIRVGRDHNLGC